MLLLICCMVFLRGSSLLNEPQVKDLIDYPMKLGSYKKKDVFIHIGPYGKYMKYNQKNYKIPQRDNYTLEELNSMLK